ncbi:hypothetical protein [Pseudomonas sp. K5002]|uniref:hypothetical protein n=1 Tax=Pseudomonas sp. K5002 TaxID=2738828 RepID=UPI0015BB93F1|nr:hypothetical protein [Pseudomonas sp. K5002]NWD85558.1 hypothetical protein [Pseudomonas sp. K5002]
MTFESAEDLRERAEAGKKNAELRELLNSINSEIKGQADNGHLEASYRLAESDIEFKDVVLEKLEEHYAVEFDEAKRDIFISWKS